MAGVTAATNRDLEKAVGDGSFRRDLYFRLHVVDINIPPLRRRPGDTLELASHLLKRFSEETGRKFRGFTPQAMELMERYRWPGNIRELSFGLAFELNALRSRLRVRAGVLVLPDDVR